MKWGETLENDVWTQGPTCWLCIRWTPMLSGSSDQRAWINPVSNQISRWKCYKNPVSNQFTGSQYPIRSAAEIITGILYPIKSAAEIVTSTLHHVYYWYSIHLSLVLWSKWLQIDDAKQIFTKWSCRPNCVYTMYEILINCSQRYCVKLWDYLSFYVFYARWLWYIYWFPF